MNLKKRIIILAIVIVVLIGAVTAGLLIREHLDSASSVQSNGCWNAGIETPDYKTLIPSGKTVEDLGDWRRISPENNDSVYGYADSIDGVRICVSQQQLPASLQVDTASNVAKLAKSYNATDTIKVDDTVLYIGNNATGPQSVIFTKQDLLILVKSRDMIKDESWQAYVKRLNLALY